jgi:hypothetical protein
MANHRARREAAAAIKEFANYHLIRTTDLLTEEKAAIESIRTAVDALNRGYTLLDSMAYADPTIGLLLNMLRRNFEHVEAAVVACVTGSGASAEVIARAAYESSVNIIYILVGDRTKERLNKGLELGQGGMAICSVSTKRVYWAALMPTTVSQTLCRA